MGATPVPDDDDATWITEGRGPETPDPLSPVVNRTDQPKGMIAMADTEVKDVRQRGGQVKDVVQRFWSKVDKSGDCWIWKPGPAGNGYGQFSVGRRQNMKMHIAHRFSYRLLLGDIPKTVALHHLCGNRLCVNPLHLQPMSLGDHCLHGAGFGAMNARKTQCIAGHPYDLFNTAFRLKRVCKACEAARMRRRRSRDK